MGPTHGEAGNPRKGIPASPEYHSWQGMMDRCQNQKNRKYPLYGGRGITVCQRWRDSFEHFLADMGRRPGPGYSLDRYPDPNGHYEPGNCRWATILEQRHNRRPNIKARRGANGKFLPGPFIETGGGDWRA